MLCPVTLAPVTCLPYPEVQTLIAVSHSEEGEHKTPPGMIAMCSGIRPGDRTAEKSCMSTSFILYQK